MPMKTITGKLLITMVSIFLLAGGIGLMQGYRENETTLLSLAETEAGALADATFDGLNKLMLAGTMGERDGMLHEVRQRPHVLGVRVLRGDAVQRQYGPSATTPADDLERSALEGKPALQIHSGENGRVLTLVRPYLAQPNHRG